MLKTKDKIFKSVYHNHFSNHTMVYLYYGYIDQGLPSKWLTMLGLFTFLPMDYLPTQELHTYLWTPYLLTLSTYLQLFTYLSTHGLCIYLPMVAYLLICGLLTYLLTQAKGYQKYKQKVTQDPFKCYLWAIQNVTQGPLKRV